MKPAPDGFLYALRGTPVCRCIYNLSTNVWSTGTFIPAAPAGEQRAAFANNYIYVLRAGSTNTFYRYSVVATTWLSMTGTNEFAPMMTNYPSLSYSSTENKIYAIRGLNTTDMWKFDPTLGTNGQWVGPKQVLDGTVGLSIRVAILSGTGRQERPLMSTRLAEEERMLSIGTMFTQLLEFKGSTPVSR